MSLNPKQSLSLRCGAAILAGLQVFAGMPTPAFAQDNGRPMENDTRTPIKHVIVILGENRSFDNVFATYQPLHGQHVRNLLSEGIVNADGDPGSNYSLAVQNTAVDTAEEGYSNSPGHKEPYATLPPPLAGGPTTPYISSLAEAKAVENGLPNDQYYTYLTTGGTGLKAGTPDTRLQNVFHLPPGPFQITHGIPYDAYTASPVHRYYQMAQQLDCNRAYATPQNPSGCKGDLFAWVEETEGAGSNGKPQPQPFTDESTREGTAAMGFYNVQQGDAPYLKYLADHYALSDNYHQAALGGTGMNHIEIGTGDALWFSDANGNPAMPPHNQLVAAGTANAGVVDEVENPDAAPGTNNWYSEDGYGGGSNGSPSYGGGSYSNCSDTSAPGVSAMRGYLASLRRPIDAKCAADHYYLLNNYNPGFFGNGANAYTDTSNQNTVFTVPPSKVRTIGDELLARNISFTYFGDDWDRYANDPYYKNPANVYCNICNFLQYSATIMANPALRSEHIKDTTDLYSEIQSGDLPAVSWVKPSGLLDGHPASSKLDLFEGFVMKIVNEVQANPKLWASTAIFITFDEGGGYYDSGYVQPLDYFGDGTRVPMIIVSPYTQGGRISHTYTDHVSMLKFIERNWNLRPVTDRSRDNLPNPQVNPANPYVPVNRPAIGDLFDMFNFGVRGEQGFGGGEDHRPAER
ncbi:MAG: alkaline phosphatase family protein [Acidobacteriota bacterium]